MKVGFKIIINLLICTYSFSLFAQNETNIYVSAHQDDWQLFMNPNAFNSVKNSNNKVVFIHTTAGDAGVGMGNDNFYLAREKGSLRAIRFMSSAFNSGVGSGTNMNETKVTINGHTILKYIDGNTVAYFLRLPDGNFDGSGYALHDYKSLEKLYNGSISNISAIDSSTTYNSLADLQETLRSIVVLESANLKNVKFNLADDDSSINPKDHSDHLNSSLIMQDIANTIGDITINLYTDYSISSKAQNLFGRDYRISAGTWGATASGLSDNFHSSTWDSDHNDYLGKQYYRTIKISNYSRNEIDSPNSGANDNIFIRYFLGCKSLFTKVVNRFSIHS